MSWDLKMLRPQMHHASIDTDHEGSTISVMKMFPIVLDETGSSFPCFPHSGRWVLGFVGRAWITWHWL